MALILWASAAIHSDSDSAAGGRVERQAVSRSIWDGVYTVDQAQQGQLAYEQNCVSCHGVELTGSAEMGPGVIGSEFVANWDGLTVGAFFDRIRTTMPADSPGRLRQAEYAALVAYLLSANKFPAGNVALPEEKPLLDSITWLRDRPGVAH